METRTEGWIAGLQLAALFLQGHRDVRAFIQAIAGDHRYMVDYLVDEVLQAHLKAEQPDLLARLHRRASAWYEQRGSAAEAIHHALAAEDFARAGDRIAMPATCRRRYAPRYTFRSPRSDHRAC